MNASFEPWKIKVQTTFRFSKLKILGKNEETSVTEQCVYDYVLKVSVNLLLIIFIFLVLHGFLPLVDTVSANWGGKIPQYTWWHADHSSFTLNSTNSPNYNWENDNHGQLLNLGVSFIKELTYRYLKVLSSPKPSHKKKLLRCGED